MGKLNPEDSSFQWLLNFINEHKFLNHHTIFIQIFGCTMLSVRAKEL